MKYQMLGTDANSEDGPTSVNLPDKYEVCWRCEGRGVHDCWEGGMTQDEMYDQDPDFWQDYKSGVYDALCSVCNGQRVLLTVDESRLSPELLAQYKESERQYDQQRAEMYTEGYAEGCVNYSQMLRWHCG